MLKKLQGWRTRLFAIFGMILPPFGIIVADQLAGIKWETYVDPWWVPWITMGAGLVVLVLRELTKGPAGTPRV